MEVLPGLIPLNPVGINWPISNNKDEDKDKDKNNEIDNCNNELVF